MGANSALRRGVKRVTRGVLGDRSYGWLQAGAMARDIARGRWSEPELELIPLAVSPGDTVLDLGANYGLWSWHLSRAVGSGGTVHAYEPVPFTVATLRRVLSLLRRSNVDVHAVACGAEPGTLVLRVPVQTSGAISAGQAHFAARNDDRPGHEAHVRWSDASAVSCPVVVLDDFHADGPEITFLKSDIEGAEALAFAGARRLLERDRPTVVVEINPWFLEGFGLDVDALLAPFYELGYRLLRYDDARRRLVDVASRDVVEDNYVLVHERRAERLSSLLS